MVIEIILTALGTAAIVSALAWLIISRKKEETSLFEDAFNTATEAMLITTPDALITKVNPAFCSITGYSEEDLIGKNPSMMKSGRHSKEFYKNMWDSLTSRGTWKGEVWDKRKSGKHFPKMLTIVAHRNRRGKVIRYVGTFTDLTGEKHSAERIDFLLNHDALTGLPSGALLHVLVGNSLSSPLQRNRRMALITLKVLRHKGVIEGFGFEGWDQLLKECAERLKKVAGDDNIVARTGTDEFTVALRDISSPEEAEAAARSITAAMSEAIIVKGQFIHIGTNMGISMSPQDTGNPELLQIYSMRALASAQDKGINFFELYRQPAGASVTDKFRVETNIRFALDNNEFVLHYQPQASLRTGAIYGAEALVRRQEPNWLVPPAHFIGVAEQTGLVLGICEWTLLEACRQHMLWRKQGLPPVRMAINASAIQFQQKKIVPALKKVIRQTGISPEFIELEVTERAFMHNAEGMIEELHALKDMGISLSIDDFGTGYSSLGYLKRFPVDSIKIDISFVREIGRSRDGETIVKTIIELAHNLGFKALGEGVETKEQLDFLITHGCDDMQGFYLSKPKPPELFAGDIRKGQRLYRHV